MCCPGRALPITTWEDTGVAHSTEPGYGTSGSALVFLDDQRAALSTVLVLQEMTLTIDVASDRNATLAWARMARYAVIVCGGASIEDLVEFALKVRASAPLTGILVPGHFGAMPEFADLDIHVLQSPVNVNALVERLRLPAA